MLDILQPTCDCTEWSCGPFFVVNGPAALSVWFWRLLVTVERGPFRVGLDWNPD